MTACIACCLVFTELAPVSAQESAAAMQSVQTYPSDYFLPFTPQTAKEMIERVPGFIFDPGSDVRGFGAAAGNVLVDGARPSSKSGGLVEALTRINADIVERIDVIRGTAGARESAGQAVVANIVTAQRDAGRWQVALERTAHGKLNSAVDLVSSHSGRAWTTETQLTASLLQRPLEGSRKSLDSSGVLRFLVAENSPSEARDLGLSSRARRTVPSGVLNMNGRLNLSPSETSIRRRGFDVLEDAPAIQASPDQLQGITIERKRLGAEFGVDWTQGLGDSWLMKLISLTSYEDFESQSRNRVERPVGTLVSSSVFDSDEEAFESIVRATLGRADERALRFEFGGELTYNRLDSLVAFQLDAGPSDAGPNLPPTEVVVEEFRGEVFANLRWAYSARLTLEAGAGVEASRISVSGDADNAQSFLFAKPYTTLIYDFRPGAQFRLDGRRSIGQLDFRDFAASVSLADDRQLDGNPALGPDQTTRLSASIDLRSEGFGAANFEVFHEWRDDVLEQIVLPSGVGGLGNAGSARVWGVRSTASLPLSAVITGARIELDASFLDSDFEDPISSVRRPLSSIDSPDVLIEFRQDLPAKNLSWGISYRPQLKGPFYFVDEISSNEDGRYWGLFAETVQFLDLKFRFDLDGIGAQNFYRERQFFEPDRSGPFGGSEVISRDQGMFARLTISGRF